MSMPLHRQRDLLLSGLGVAGHGHRLRSGITPEMRMQNNWTIVLAKHSYQSISQGVDDLGLEPPDLPIEPRLLL
jgi:hypothetical protein